MARTTDTFTISLPPAMLKQLEKVRKEEHRTRSELMREALRQYMVNRYPAEKATKVETAAMRRGMEEFRRGEYTSLTDYLNGLDPVAHKNGPKRPRKAAAKRAR